MFALAFRVQISLEFRRIKPVKTLLRSLRKLRDLAVIVVFKRIIIIDDTEIENLSLILMSKSIEIQLTRRATQS